MNLLEFNFNIISNYLENLPYKRSDLRRFLMVIPFLQDNNYKLIGINYRSLTDKPYAEHPIKQMIEGGFLVESVENIENV